ncbi:hypothetical protein [Shimazuella kribbensis]|uniref:hypothetical protein n=1 Tax=Shimazuella kribbensis TaxID=139808 RepID=UPI0004272A7E|nr:hypothetical protein [Shimazuella kribbensis]
MITVDTMDGEVTIPLGVITPETIDAYRHGQCWALSRAISEHTGWPMVWIYALSRVEGKGNSTPWTKWRVKRWTKRWDGRSITEMTQYFSEEGFLHGLVKTPDGKFLDIGEVAHSTRWKEMYADFGPCALIEIPYRTMDEMFFDPVKPNMEAARGFVSVVLNRAGYASYV